MLNCKPLNTDYQQIVFLLLSYLSLEHLFSRLTSKRLLKNSLVNKNYGKVYFIHLLIGFNSQMQLDFNKGFLRSDDKIDVYRWTVASDWHETGSKKCECRH